MAYGSPSDWSAGHGPISFTTPILIGCRNGSITTHCRLVHKKIRLTYNHRLLWIACKMDFTSSGPQVFLQAVRAGAVRDRCVWLSWKTRHCYSNRWWRQCLAWRPSVWQADLSTRRATSFGSLPALAVIRMERRTRSEFWLKVTGTDAFRRARRAEKRRQ